MTISEQQIIDDFSNCYSCVRRLEMLSQFDCLLDINHEDYTDLEKEVVRCIHIGKVFPDDIMLQLIDAVDVDVIAGLMRHANADTKFNRRYQFSQQTLRKLLSHFDFIYYLQSERFWESFLYHYITHNDEKEKIYFSEEYKLFCERNGVRFASGKLPREIQEEFAQESCVNPIPFNCDLVIDTDLQYRMLDFLLIGHNSYEEKFEVGISDVFYIFTDIQNSVINKGLLRSLFHEFKEDHKKYFKHIDKLVENNELSLYLGSLLSGKRSAGEFTLQSI